MPSRSRSKRRSNRRFGRIVGAEPLSGGQPASVHIPATLQAAARQAGGTSRGVTITPRDLRATVRSVPLHRLIVFAVDASDSMSEGASTARIAVAKGTVLALLGTAYLNRDRVCLVAFGDDDARMILPPTGSIDLARKRLQAIPVGGSTPLAKGLLACRDVIRRERQIDPDSRPLLVLLSDGAATTPLCKGIEPEADARAVAGQMAHDGVPAVLIETGSARPSRLMQDLAAIFQTRCHRTTDLKSCRVVDMIHSTGRGA